MSDIIYRAIDTYIVGSILKCRDKTYNYFIIITSKRKKTWKL